MKFLYPINLTKNELQNAVIQNLATAPASPKVGQIYFDTGENDLKIYNGVTWLSALEPGTKINGETGELTLVGGDKINLVKSGKTFTLSHDKIANSNLVASGRRYVTGLEFDDYGHVTGVTTGTETVVNTNDNTTYSIKAGTATGGAKVDLDAGGSGSGTDSVTFKGNDSVTVSRTGAKEITISAPDTTYGVFDANADGLAPKSGTDTGKFLRGDGTWATPENTTYDLAPYAKINGPSFTGIPKAPTAANEVNNTQIATTAFVKNQGYITSYTETDPIFTAWDKSTGISITKSQVSDFPTSMTPTSHTHGSITNDGKIGTTANLMLKTGVGGAIGTMVAGTAGQFLNGLGNWATPPNTTYTAGTKLTLSGNTFNHSSQTIETTDGAVVNLVFGETFRAVGEVEGDSTGHLTKAKEFPFKMPNETPVTAVRGAGAFTTSVTATGHNVTLGASDTITRDIGVKSLTTTGDVSVGGNLIVSGTTTTLNTEKVLIKDNIIEINSNQEGIPSPTLVSGLEVNRGSEDNFQFAFVEATTDFRVGKGTNLQPVLTREEVGDMSNNGILTWDATNKRAKTLTPAGFISSNNITRKFATNQEIAPGETYTITHGLETADVTVILKDITSNEIVFADVKTTGVNTISIGFGEINGITSIRVVVIG